MKQAVMVTAIALALVVPAGSSDASSHGIGQRGSHEQHHALTNGEVRKIDKEARKLTLRHEAIQNLEMPPMTMVFQVSDPSLLDKVKAGDKVRFSADKLGGTYTVTHLEIAK